jgi:hypothetical protein
VGGSEGDQKMTQPKEKTILPRPIKRIMLEYGNLTKEQLVQIIEESYGKNLLSLMVDKNGVRVELIELMEIGK